VLRRTPRGWPRRLPPARAGCCCGGPTTRTARWPGPARSAGRPAATLYPADGGGRPNDRELQILGGFSHGFTHGAIGRELSLSEDTVKAHSRRLLRKLGARDRAHAVALGIRKGLVA